MEIIPLTQTHRGEVNDFVRDEWGGPMIVSRGNLFDSSALPGFVAVEENELLGVVLYRMEGSDCEIALLHALAQNRGVGTALIRQVISIAEAHACRRVWLITTNDNTQAIRFYQKFGFALKAVHINSMAASRQLKPCIPELGEDGIPIAHEFEFELAIG